MVGVMRILDLILDLVLRPMSRLRTIGVMQVTYLILHMVSGQASRMLMFGIGGNMPRVCCILGTDYFAWRGLFIPIVLVFGRSSNFCAL